MRVLLTLDAVGGVWRYAMDLAAGLKGHGVEAAFLGFGPEPGAEQRGEAERLGPLAWSGAPLDWLAEDEGALAGVGPAVAEAARAAGADVAQANGAAQAAGVPPGLPVVAVSHSCVPTWFRAVRGPGPEGGLPPGWEWHGRVQARGLARADAAVAPSHAHAALMRAAHGPLPRLRVVLNGSGAAEMDGAPEPFVLALGRWWDEGKGGAVLDAAAARAGWPVRMAGATVGPNGARFEARHAEDLGEVPGAEARRLLASAGLFVSPSLYEPFGLAVVEAARAARPLLLADIPTFRELWDGAAAFFPARDAGALAALMDRLAADPSERARLGAAARERSRRFGLAPQAAAMAGLYRELARQPAGAR